jgi:hypothetical protein
MYSFVCHMRKGREHFRLVANNFVQAEELNGKKGRKMLNADRSVNFNSWIFNQITGEILCARIY